MKVKLEHFLRITCPEKGTLSEPFDWLERVHQGPSAQAQRAHPKNRVSIPTMIIFVDVFFSSEHYLFIVVDV